MKYQFLFSLKSNKKKFTMSSTTILLVTLRINLNSISLRKCIFIFLYKSGRFAKQKIIQLNYTSEKPSPFRFVGIRKRSSPHINHSCINCGFIFLETVLACFDLD